MRGAAEFQGKLGEWAAAARSNPLFWRGVLGAGAIVVLDQASKYWVVNLLRLPERPRGRIELSPVFDLTYVQNYGASFGLLSGGPWRLVLSAVSVAVATVLIVWLGRMGRGVAATGIALIIGGALGNLYDRVAYGYVVDFLDFSGLLFPWVFNVADAAINIGVGFLLLDAWLTREKKGGAKPGGP